MAQTQNPVESATGRANPNGRFKNKVVLITGATSGIGKNTAYAFADEGAKVFFCGRRKELGEQNAREIEAFGGQEEFLQADVRREQDIKNLVDGGVKKCGRIGIALNNAGVESPPATVAEHSLEIWMNVMTTKATGVFLSMKYELPVMLRQNGGVIVNNASVSDHVGFATIALYSASKNAIVSLTKVAALGICGKKHPRQFNFPARSIRRC